MSESKVKYFLLSISVIAFLLLFIACGYWFVIKDNYYECVNQIIKGNNNVTSIDRDICRSKIEYKILQKSEIDNIFITGSASAVADERYKEKLTFYVENKTGKRLQKLVISVKEKKPKTLSNAVFIYEGEIEDKLSVNFDRSDYGTRFLELKDENMIADGAYLTSDLIFTIESAYTF